MDRYIQLHLEYNVTVVKKENTLLMIVPKMEKRLTACRARLVPTNHQIIIQNVPVARVRWNAHTTQDKEKHRRY